MNGTLPPDKKSRTIRVNYMSRVEGGASLAIRLKGDQVRDVSSKSSNHPGCLKRF